MADTMAKFAQMSWDEKVRNKNRAVRESRNKREAARPKSREEQNRRRSELGLESLEKQEARQGKPSAEAKAMTRGKKFEEARQGKPSAEAKAMTRGKKFEPTVSSAEAKAVARGKKFDAITEGGVMSKLGVDFDPATRKVVGGHVSNVKHVGDLQKVQDSLKALGAHGMPGHNKSHTVYTIKSEDGIGVLVSVKKDRPLKIGGKTIKGGGVVEAIRTAGGSGDPAGKKFDAVDRADRMAAAGGSGSGHKGRGNWGHKGRKGVRGGSA